VRRLNANAHDPVVQFAIMHVCTLNTV